MQPGVDLSPQGERLGGTGLMRRVSRRETLSVIGVVVGLIVLVVASDRIAHALHTDEDAIFPMVFGLALAVCALTHPWWFWWHAKALFVRSIIGDRLASVFYLLVGLGLAGTGVVRFRMWAEDVATCRSALAAAANTHERMRVLYKDVPRPKMPGILQLLDRWEPLTCERYRERGAF